MSSRVPGEGYEGRMGDPAMGMDGPQPPTSMRQPPMQRQMPNAPAPPGRQSQGPPPQQGAPRWSQQPQQQTQQTQQQTQQQAKQQPAGGAAAGSNYIGKRISLTSKSEIRYEGTLYQIDPKASTVALEHVRSFGSEGRPRNGPQVPPSNEVYSYIVFRAPDIKDLKFLPTPAAQPAPQQQMPADPAIVASGYDQQRPYSMPPGRDPMYRGGPPEPQSQAPSSGPPGAPAPQHDPYAARSGMGPRGEAPYGANDAGPPSRGAQYGTARAGAPTWGAPGGARAPYDGPLEEPAAAPARPGWENARSSRHGMPYAAPGRDMNASTQSAGRPAAVGHRGWGPPPTAKPTAAPTKNDATSTAWQSNVPAQGTWNEPSDAKASSVTDNDASANREEAPAANAAVPADPAPAPAPSPGPADAPADAPTEAPAEAQADSSAERGAPGVTNAWSKPLEAASATTPNPDTNSALGAASAAAKPGARQPGTGAWTGNKSAWDRGRPMDDLNQNDGQRAQHNQHNQHNQHGQHNQQNQHNQSNRATNSSQWRSGRKVPIVIPKEDFDFEAMNDKFEKVGVAEDGELPEEMPKFEKKYDATKSFFDDLVAERSTGEGRIRDAERKNMETFGEANVRKRYGGQRGGRRGGSSGYRGGGNTGGQNRNNSGYRPSNRGGYTRRDGWGPSRDGGAGPRDGARDSAKAGGD